MAPRSTAATVSTDGASLRPCLRARHSATGAPSWSTTPGAADRLPHLGARRLRRPAAVTAEQQRVARAEQADAGRGRRELVAGQVGREDLPTANRERFAHSDASSSAAGAY